ncbi:hypothetical protein BKH42_04960 [Helicobacter sp. 13S00482-2]|uniref:GNAT family N-acetyltransferase n=1 Tax=Helicobacter sp. 13S00482-2 TaxID=1476200 RepID=UPI000BA63C9E|nr:GNAT family N-acetyltransferase [Helicobacter sp. 13S00482-2]PAF53671.1 hypothetical protein BKH42_04960 [Helicobacter sp. 13S00482-2]
MEDFQKMDLKKIHSQILLIKKNAKNIYTNFYTQENIIYQVKILSDCIIILKQEQIFWRLYFFSNDIEKLQDALDQIRSNIPICIEIIQKQEEIILDSIQKQTIYLRLRKNLSKIPKTDLQQISNKKASPKEFYKLIQKDFNIYFDHLPTLETIENWIKNKKILYINQEEKIISYLVFNIKGKGAYINYIANYGGKNSLIRIWEMFYQELNKFDIEFIYLWCDTKNTKAMNMYEIEGFYPDGLKNFIYLKTPRLAKEKNEGGGGQ